MTPSPTLKPEIRIDNDISPMKPLPPPTEHRRPFSYEGPGEQPQGSPKQQKAPQRTVKESTEEGHEQVTLPTVTSAVPTPQSQPAFPLRTTSLDPPEPSPSIRPSTAPAPQSTFSSTHPSLSTHTPPLPPTKTPPPPPTKTSPSSP